MAILQWILFFVIVLVLAKVIEHFQYKKREYDELKQNVRRQAVENTRLKSMITNQCPDCGKEKTEEYICECGFTYADGNYCAACKKYLPFSELKKGYDMMHPHEPYIYECKKCEGKIFSVSS